MGGSYLYGGAVPTYYDISKMWTGPGDTNATLPKFEYGSAASLSSRWLMPTDYLRLKNLTLGVSIPQNYISKLGLSKARIYFSGSNLLTWKSKDLFVDPEMRVDGLCTFETPALKNIYIRNRIEFLTNKDTKMKILKTLYTATLCAAMAVSTSSCLNSWLDQSPADGIDAETAIKNSD